MLRFIFVIIINYFRIVHAIFKMRFMNTHPDLFTEQERYDFVRDRMIMVNKTGHIKTEVYGLENLPREGGYVMYPNHQGKYDSLAIITAHEKPCTFVMDDKKSYMILVKEVIDTIGAKRLVIGDVRQNMGIISEITEDVKEGKKYILFSEGGYDHNKNNVQEFKPGSFKCATRAKAPIVPVALMDTYQPFNSNRLGRCTAKVYFLPPLYYEDYKDKKTPEIAAEVKQRIVERITA